MSSLCSVGHWSGHQAVEGSNVTKDLKLHAILCLTLPNQEPQSGCTTTSQVCSVLLLGPFHADTSGGAMLNRCRPWAHVTHRMAP